jgi:hypothetical protein
MGDYTKYKVRTCKSLHFCAICKGRIEYGHKYYDGGYDKRAHDLCVEANELEKQAQKAMAQANTDFYKLEGEGRPCSN